MRKSTLVRRWQDGLSLSAVEDIKSALLQLDADEQYEQSGPTVRETLQVLHEIGLAGGRLLAALNSLSTIGMAAIFESGERFRLNSERPSFRFTGRFELKKIIGLLTPFISSAEFAPNLLLDMHSPTGDVGQGSGSAQGRDSDLRVLRAGEECSTLPPFRSPKDRFAISVIKALIADSRASEHTIPTQSDMAATLKLIWLAHFRAEVPNFERALRATSALTREVEGRERRRASAARINARLPDLRRDGRRFARIGKDASSRRLGSSRCTSQRQEVALEALKVADAAARIGLSVSTLNKWRTDGRGPRYVKLGRSVCYLVKDLDAWLEQHRRQSTSEPPPAGTGT